MATTLKRLDFKRQYPATRQDLFIVSSEKRLPKKTGRNNIGRLISEALVEMVEDDCPDAIVSLIRLRHEGRSSAVNS